jgi:hypothetical protein
VKRGLKKEQRPRSFRALVKLRFSVENMKRQLPKPPCQIDQAAQRLRTKSESFEKLTELKPFSLT